MRKKYLKLLVCIVLDGLGYLSYSVLGVGEVVDVIWAPIAAWLNYRLFSEQAGAGGALFTFIEEALPGTDFIPSFTITWFYAYVIRNHENAQKAESILERFTKLLHNKK